jgi:hypothetical protein
MSPHVSNLTPGSLAGRSPQHYLAEADLTDDSISRLRMAFMRD